MYIGALSHGDRAKNGSRDANIAHEDGQHYRASNICEDNISAYPTLMSRPLDEWRQMDMNERKELLTGAEMSKLTKLLLADYADHYNCEEKITPEGMNPDGAHRLCTAIIRSCINPILEFESYKYNGWIEFKRVKTNGVALTHKATVELKEDYDAAIRELNNPTMEIYLMGLSPDAVIRETKFAAKKRVDEVFKRVTYSLSREIDRAKVTSEELCEQLGGIERAELAHWLHRPYMKYEKQIRKAIRAIKKIKKTKGRKKK